MRRKIVILCVALVVGCSKKTEATSCEIVAQRLVELEVGEAVSFMTKNERTARARHSIASCDLMTEDARRCVLAATTMVQVDACSRGDITTAPGAPDKAAWVLRAGDASYQSARFVTLAADGDVIVAGYFEGTLELGEQVLTAQLTDAWVARLSPSGTVRWAKRAGDTSHDFVVGLTLGANDRILIGVEEEDETPRFSHVTYSPDGMAMSTLIETKHRVDAAALHPDGDVVVAGRVVEVVKGGTCAAMGFVLQRFAADGKLRWSRCNDGKAAVMVTDDLMQLAVGPGGMSAACGGFSGALTWGGHAAPAGSSDERAFVLALDAKGKPRWASFVAGKSDVFCDALAVSDDHSVFAIVRGPTPGSALAVWETDGTQRWMRSCRDLLGTSEECVLSALTVSGSDVIVAAWDSERTVFATIDGQAGTRRQASTFVGGQPIKRIAVRNGALVFAASLYGRADFGTGPVESTRGDDNVSADVLIGRLQEVWPRW